MDIDLIFNILLHDENEQLHSCFKMHYFLVTTHHIPSISPQLILPYGHCEIRGLLLTLLQWMSLQESGFGSKRENPTNFPPLANAVNC